MKKLIFIGLALITITATACSKENDKPADCIRCYGCFNTWDECADSYRPNEQNPMTWEEYKDYMLNNHQTTIICERHPQ